MHIVFWIPQENSVADKAAPFEYSSFTLPLTANFSIEGPSGSIR